MGVPKRKAPGGQGGAGAAKRARTEELTGVRFKAQLREPQGAGPALEAFVSAAKKLPQEDMYDVVEGYIKISVECAELFQLVSGEKPPASEVLPLFQAFEAILLRTASDLSHFHTVGTNIVKKFLNNHMKLLCESLYASGYKMARACLNLMAAMVTQGPEAARDVSSLFDLNKKTLYSLANKRDSKGGQDVRQAYIQFALAFLIAGDDSTIVQVLEVKEFIPCVFSSGIKEDRISTISLLLSTLKTKVVHNKSITKTQKVRFFTGQLLNHIAQLYAWNGVVDVDLENAQAPAEDAGKAMVRGLVHSFLMDLCCSLKHGINFYDASLGTSGRGGNLTLLHFLLGLKTAADDELVTELVVNILRVCPDLLNKYFKEVTFSFTPRVKATWTNNIKLLNKIYAAQPDISRAFQTHEFIPLPRLLAMVMVTTVPPVCNKTTFTQALNLDSKAVKHTALSLLSVILKRALKTMEHCLDREAWQESGVYTASMMEDFVRLFREALSKIVPDLNTIVWVWQSLVKQETNLDDKKGKRDKGTPAEAEPEGPPHDDAETILLKAVLLQVICLYQKAVPHVVMQYNFDFSKLLKGVICEQGLWEEVPPVLQHHMLKVALELPASKFLWLKAQEGPDAEIIGGERSVFYLLMKMFVTSSHVQLKSSTRLLIMKILRDTGVFEHTWKELELWLEHLDNTKEENRETVIQFLERVLLTLVASPYPYTDKASDFVQEASTLQASLARHDADDISIPISHIDDVLDMVDVLVEGSEGLDEDIGFELNEDMALLTFPFSAVVPAALEARNKLLLEAESKAGESIMTYLTAVLTDLLHSQRDPLALCLLLQAYDKPGPLSPRLCHFGSYYRLWIPQTALEASLPQTPDSLAPQAPGTPTFSALLQAAYQREGGLLDEGVQAQLQAALLDLPLHQTLRTAKQLLLYLRSTVENFRQLGRSTGPLLLELLLDLLRHLLLHCQRLDAQNRQMREATQAEAEASLFLDVESEAELELAHDKTLEEVLAAILRHPTLEGWFLALERQALPPHGLSPTLVKLLGARLTAGVLPLLLAAAPTLQDIGQPGLLATYSDAVTQSVLTGLRGLSSSPGAAALPQLEALRGLHPYLEAAQLRQVTLALLGLPEARLVAGAGAERRLTVLGQTLVQLLTRGPQAQAQAGGGLLWASEAARGLGALLPALHADEPDAALLEILQAEPALAAVVGADLLDYCLARRTPTALGLAALLLRHSRSHLLRFELWCRRLGAGSRLRDGLAAFLPVLLEYLQRRPEELVSRPSGASSATVPILRKALWGRLQSRLLAADGPPESGLQQEVLAKLVPFARPKALTALMEHLPGLLQTPGGLGSWVVADSVTSALGESAEQLQAWRETLLASCVKWLVASFSNSQHSDQDSARDLEKQMLQRFTELVTSLKEVDPDDWQKLVKAGLKFRYRDHAFLQALHAAIQRLYVPESTTRSKLLPLPTVHVMLTQHSLFLPTLLASDQEGDPDDQVREALVELMAAVVRTCPSVCESSHFAVLLGAYGASLSVLDQKILLLLRAYEQNRLSLIDFRVLLWGPAAVEHHKTCRSLGKSLWQEPSVGDILRLLDRDRMLRTVLHFPQSRRLLPPEDSKDPIFKDGSTKLDDLYDPCFLLHLFSELTRPEFVVDCRKFLDSNALGLTVAALSSYDPQMRAAAYSVLGAYYSHVEGARFREQPQLLYLLDVVRNGIRTQNMRLTFTLALFIAKAALQILKPEEHMYLKINRFLLSHEYLNMNKIPGFYQFFYSSDFEQEAEREWILGVLRQGLRDKHCYELYARRGVFTIILSFFHSPLCGEAAQNGILETLQNAAQDPKSAYEILRDHSLLTWVLHVLESKFLETPLLSSVISLLHTLWVTNLGDKDVEAGGQPPQGLGSQEPPKLLALHVVDEFLYVLLALARHLRPTLAPTQLTSFFRALDSVLRYRASVLRAFRNLGRLTVNQAVLSTADILVLLHKWSLTERDSRLQEALRDVVERHPTRELQKMLKDKSKAGLPTRTKGARAQGRRPRDSEQTAPAELPAATLETCRDLLRSIVTHWAPVLPGSDNPAPAAVVPVGSWLLRSASESAPSRVEMARLLTWLRAHVLPRPEVAAELLGDPAVHGGLFRLYSQLCGARELVEPQGLAGLFSSVMLQLLAARSPPRSPLHPAMETLCLTATDDGKEEAEQAAAAFLLSLYIKDVWLGAHRPDSLLTHVRMVLEAAGAEPSSQEDAIVRLCRDIAASAPDT